MQAFAGPGDSAPGLAAADWGALGNPQNDGQDVGILLDQAETPDWLQDQHWLNRNAPEPGSAPGDGAAGLPAADGGAIDNLENEQDFGMLDGWSPV
ncbi:hypothetical protein, partial [Mesorhizobium sp. 128a]